MRLTLGSLFTLFILTGFGLLSHRIRPGDLKTLSGPTWKGSLTYLDYSSKKRTIIPAHLTVVPSQTEKGVWYFKNEYPLEPKANNTDTVVVGKDGKTIGGEEVVDRRKAGPSTIQIVTQRKHTEEGEELLFRYTYSISKNRYSVKKEERKLPDTLFIERNTYTYKRD